MTDTWQLSEAKRRLGEVVDLAAVGLPQIITRRGKPVAVVLDFDDYIGSYLPRLRLVDALRTAPAGLAELDFGRDPSLPSELLKL